MFSHVHFNSHVHCHVHIVMLTGMFIVMFLVMAMLLLAIINTMNYQYPCPSASVRLLLSAQYMHSPYFQCSSTGANQCDGRFSNVSGTGLFAVVLVLINDHGGGRRCLLEFFELHFDCLSSDTGILLRTPFDEPHEGWHCRKDALRLMSYSYTYLNDLSADDCSWCRSCRST